MKLDDILSAAGKNKSRTRLGRGIGSGHGKTSGRGTKGMNARAGRSSRLGYEGGQNPIIARSPKRGFSNVLFRKAYQIVNVQDLSAFEDGTKVDADLLADCGLIDDAALPVKVLAKGELQRKLTVVADKFSPAAAEKISAAGGTVEQPQQG